MKKYYTTFLFFTYRPGSKLEEAFLEYLNENYCRILITEDKIEDFKNVLIEKYKELSKKFYRCKATPLDFSGKFRLQNEDEFCLDRDFYQLRFLKNNKEFIIQKTNYDRI